MAIEKWGNWSLNKTLITAGSAHQSVVADLPNGGYVVVWCQSTTLSLQVFDAAGNAKPRQTIDSATLEKFQPDIAVLKDGSFIVTWSGGSKEILGLKFSIDGTPSPLGHFTVAETTAGHNQNFPATATSGDRWVTVWADYVGSTTDSIKFARHNDDGTTTIISVGSGQGVQTPDVAELSGGGHVVTWAESGIVKAALVAEDGKVHPLSVENLPGAGYNPSVTALSNGGFVLVVQDASASTYRTQVYDSSGAKVSTGSHILSTTGAEQPPAVVALTKGGFEGGYAVVHSAPVKDGNGNTIDNGDIFLTVVKADGTKSTIMVNDTSWDGLFPQTVSSVSELPDGRLVVVWDDPSSSGVRHQIIDARDEVVRVVGTDGADFYIGTDLEGKDTLEGGKGNDTLWGGAGDDLIEGGAGADHLDGGAGGDLASYENAAAAVVADLKNSANNAGEAEGDTYTSIEHLVGSAHSDTLKGNDVHNGLYGEDGNDTLYGGAGADYFFGGADRDVVTYQYSTAGVGVTVSLQDPGLNTREAQGDIYNSIEVLVGTAWSDKLTGRNTAGQNGESIDDEIYGGYGHDTVEGGEGNDALSGGNDNDLLLGGTGQDTLRGNEGDDTLEGGAGNDSLDSGTGDDTLEGGAGNDILDGGEGLHDFASYANAAGPIVANLGMFAPDPQGEPVGDTYVSIEGLIGSQYDDDLYGSDAFAVELRGEGGNDTLTGGSLSDTLKGGAGADLLIGGGYSLDFASYAHAGSGVVADLTNVYEEFAPGGLVAGTNDAAGDRYHDIEGLIGSGFADTLYGNAAANHLRGEGGNDVLVGRGSADTLDGGAGHDTYHVSDAADRVMESAGNGTDTVIASTHFSLMAGAHVENLTAVAGTAGFRLTGSDLANRITGNGGNNTLKGEGGNDVIVGGAGTDTMYGGTGNDTFYVDRTSDRVIEYSRGGTDTVRTTVSFTVSSSNQIEAVTATGRSNVTLKGNSLANTITGNDGSNKLYGGLGNDVLKGDSGRDTFVFDTRPNRSSNVDRIVDFKSSDDRIHLDNKYFTKLGSGSSSGVRLKSDMFVENTRARDKEDRIVYDKNSGALYYDADGTGSSAQVKIATISNKTKLYYHDFYVI